MLKAGVKKLGVAESKVKFMYNELAPRIALFGRLVSAPLMLSLGGSKH